MENAAIRRSKFDLLKKQLFISWSFFFRSPEKNDFLSHEIRSHDHLPENSQFKKFVESYYVKDISKRDQNTLASWRRNKLQNSDDTKISISTWIDDWNMSSHWIQISHLT
jgi:hypothetical protein